MRVILPTLDLKIFGFRELDVLNLQKILKSDILKNYYSLEEIDGQLFDLGAFVYEIIKNKLFRQDFLKACYKTLDDFPNCILINMPLNPNELSFKLNLFMLLIDSLDKNNCVNPLYAQFLELDKRAYRKNNSLLDAFFKMCRLNLIEMVDVLNIISECNTLERSGWVGTNVPTNHKESIAEHMYVMHTMANIYLPNELDDLEYDKNKILNMIMIHDLAETLIGDIPHPMKTDADELKEDLAAKALWCNLLYNSSSAAEQIYESWNEWSLNLTINAKIAHDFDAIQLNYQFFTYACKYPNTYSDENILRWTKRQPTTEIGKKIYKEVILNNSKFISRINVIKDIFNY